MFCFRCHVQLSCATTHARRTVSVHKEYLRSSKQFDEFTRKGNRASSEGQHTFKTPSCCLEPSASASWRTPCIVSEAALHRESRHACFCLSKLCRDYLWSEPRTRSASVTAKFLKYLQNKTKFTLVREYTRTSGAITNEYWVIVLCVTCMICKYMHTCMYMYMHVRCVLRMWHRVQRARVGLPWSVAKCNRDRSSRSPTTNRDRAAAWLQTDSTLIASKHIVAVNRQGFLVLYF